MQLTHSTGRPISIFSCYVFTEFYQILNPKCRNQFYLCYLMSETVYKEINSDSYPFYQEFTYLAVSSSLSPIYYQQCSMKKEEIKEVG